MVEFKGYNFKHEQNLVVAKKMTSTLQPQIKQIKNHNLEIYFDMDCT